MANGHNSIISNLCTTNLVTTATDKRIPSAFGSHYVRDGLVHPLFILGERYISDNERLFMELLRRGLGKWRVLPRGWTGMMINAKINSAPGNGTNCWDLLIVFEGFLLIIHPERTEGWGVWCWTYPSFSQGHLHSLALLSHLSGISGSGLPMEIDSVAKLSLSGVISEIKKKKLCTREHKLD